MKLLKALIPACSFFLLLFAGVAPAPAAGDGITITEMAVTTKIVRGNPIDSVHRISSTSVKALYCFTRLQNPSDEETVIRHVWYRDNEKVGDYQLPVKGEKWRTFSKKAIEKGWSGEWRVEALDQAGHLLKTVTFRMN